MTKVAQRKLHEEETKAEPIPFDDALRKILSAPPQHKSKPKTKQRRKTGP